MQPSSPAPADSRAPEDTPGSDGVSASGASASSAAFGDSEDERLLVEQALAQREQVATGGESPRSSDAAGALAGLDLQRLERDLAAQAAVATGVEGVEEARGGPGEDSVAAALAAEEAELEGLDILGGLEDGLGEAW